MSLLRYLPQKPTPQFLILEVDTFLKDLSLGNLLAEARYEAALGDCPDIAPITSIQEILASEYGFESWDQLFQHVKLIDQVEKDIEDLRASYHNASSTDERQIILQGHHSIKRFENLDPTEQFLSDHDARVLLANKREFAHWVKYHAYLHLVPEVQKVIEAIESNDIESLQRILIDYQHAANPKWVPGFTEVDDQFSNLINDCIPLFRVSRAVFEGKIPRGKIEYEFIKLLTNFGADIEFDHGHPLTAAVSFGAQETTRTLLDFGANVDGSDEDGTPMALAIRFGQTEIIELLVEKGAKLDMRFAAATGDLSRVKWFVNADGSLASGAGELTDPFKRNRSVIYPKTQQTILSQAFLNATRFFHFDISDFLLECGTDISAIIPGLDQTGTALHWCSYVPLNTPVKKVSTRVKYLLDNGADPLIETPNGQKAMDWANTPEIKKLLQTYAHAPPAE